MFDPKEYSNYALSWTWFNEIRELLGDLCEPAADYLGHLMTKDMATPRCNIKASAMQALSVLAWMHERGLTVKEFYEDPKFFQELRITMVAYALSIYPDEPESDEKLINIAIASERILQGHKEEHPWEAIKADMADPIAA